MHKQGLRLSHKLESERANLPAPTVSAAQDHIWQSQCNCGYWHGVFGGLYLPHLRFALYRELIDAQRALDPALLGGAPYAWDEGDWNFDGKVEYLLNTPALLMGFTAEGAVDQLWLKRTRLNLCDTLTRRPEAYHAFVTSGPQGGTKLENQIGSKEEGLSAFLIYDRRVRTTFSEWLLEPDATFAAYRQQVFSPLGEIHFGEATLTPLASGTEVTFRGQAVLPGGTRLEIKKVFSLPHSGSSMTVAWSFHAQGGEARFRFAAETLYCLLAGNAPDRYVAWNENGEARRSILASHGDMPGVTQLDFIDEWLRLGCRVSAPGAGGFWRDALETVSQSEGGYERVFQGSVAAPVWDFILVDGAEAVAEVKLEFREDSPHGEQGS